MRGNCIYVLTGSHEEFRRQKSSLSTLDGKEYIYINKPKDLLGLNNIDIIFLGQYWRNPLMKSMEGRRLIMIAARDTQAKAQVTRIGGVPYKQVHEELNRVFVHDELEKAKTKTESSAQVYQFVEEREKRDEPKHTAPAVKTRNPRRI